jgi:hypothetical protein
MWRVVDNDSGEGAVVSTAAEAIGFVNKQFNVEAGDEPFSIEAIGPAVPRPLSVIIGWATNRDDQRTDGKIAPIVVEPVVTDGDIHDADVWLWGNVLVKWDHDRYIVTSDVDGGLDEAQSSDELIEILDAYLADYDDPNEPAQEPSADDRMPTPRALTEFGAASCDELFDMLDDDALLWLAATTITLGLWRNTAIENWHVGRSPLHDGTMMRINSATTRMVRSMLSFERVDWVALALAVVNPARVLPTGLTVLDTGRACHNPADPAHSDDPQEDLASMAADAVQWGRTQRVLEREFDLRTLVRSRCAHDNGWFGTPSWPRRVERFCEAVDDQGHSQWNAFRGKSWFDEWFTCRPASISETAELRRLLLAGPDLLPEDAAEWCVDAGIGFVCGGDHQGGCRRCGITPGQRPD